MTILSILLPQEPAVMAKTLPISIMLNTFTTLNSFYLVLKQIHKIKFSRIKNDLISINFVRKQTAR